MNNLHLLIKENYTSKTDAELKEISRGMKEYIKEHQFTEVQMCRKYQQCIENIHAEINKRAFAKWDKKR
jgi:carbamate kinase